MVHSIKQRVELVKEYGEWQHAKGGFDYVVPQMVCGISIVGYGVQHMVYGISLSWLWCTVHGIWYEGVGYGVWCVVSGIG